MLSTDHYVKLLLKSILLRIHSGEEQFLSWDERLQIALDVSHGIEYLHEGVCLTKI